MNKLLELIRKFEGCRLKAYLCPAGVWTIGYGATGKGIGPGVVWTKEQAEERLRRDALIFWNGTARLCPLVRFNENQWAAIADFAYNLGLTKLAGSTLRRKYNKGDFLGAANEFEKWVWAGGKKLPGLIRRRKAEKELFLSEDSWSDSRYVVKLPETVFYFA